MQSLTVQSTINANTADRRDGTGLLFAVWKNRSQLIALHIHSSHTVITAKGKLDGFFLWGFSQFARVRVVQTVRYVNPDFYAIY